MKVELVFSSAGYYFFGLSRLVNDLSYVRPSRKAHALDRSEVDLCDTSFKDCDTSFKSIIFLLIF